MEIYQIAMKRRLLLLASILAVKSILVSCSDRASSELGVWNSETATFSLDYVGLTYTLPSEISLWVIADKEALPPEMSFFAIDRSEEIVVGIFSPDKVLRRHKDIDRYSELEVDLAIRRMSNPTVGQVVVDEKVDKRREQYKGMDAWKFLINRKILDNTVSGDTIAIYYSGYIFDSLNPVYGFMMISGVCPEDSVSQDLFNKYISTLSFGGI